jgi:hypothetical protein
MLSEERCAILNDLTRHSVLDTWKIVLNHASDAITSRQAADAFLQSWLPIDESKKPLQVSNPLRMNAK